MRRELADLLACPEDAAYPLLLEVTRADHGEQDSVADGWLSCPRCQRRFVVSDGIPDLLPRSLAEDGAAKRPESREVHDKRSEMAARDHQAAEYHTFCDTFGDAMEIEAFLRYGPCDPDAVVLDAGAGTGRVVLPVARRCRWLVAADFSRRSLEILGAAAQQHGLRVDLVRADICALPFRDRAFHHCVSAQVLQHIPSPSARTIALRQVHRVLKSEGTLELSSYNNSLPKRWAYLRGYGEDTARLGYHTGEAIYYYRYSLRELRKLAESLFRVEYLVGVAIPYLAPFGRAGAHVERLLQRISLSAVLGDLLFMRARKVEHGVTRPRR